MENKRVVPVWVSVVLLILCVATLVLDIVGIASNSFDYYSISSIFVAIAIISAVLYCLTGYKKNSAPFFKVVVIANLVSTIIALLLDYSLGLTGSIIEYFNILVFFGCFTVFAVAQNIGKKTSIGMALILVITQIINFVSFLTAFNMTRIGPAVSTLLQAFIFLIMVIAKYADKAARGTK